jgi:hypothetical protein
MAAMISMDQRETRPTPQEWFVHCTKVSHHLGQEADDDLGLVPLRLRLMVAGDDRHLATDHVQVAVLQQPVPPPY